MDNGDTTEYKGVVIQSTPKRVQGKPWRDCRFPRRTHARASSFEFGIFNKPIPSILPVRITCVSISTLRSSAKTTRYTVHLLIPWPKDY